VSGARLINRGWDGPAVVRDHRTLKRAGGEDNMPRVDLAMRGFERVAAAAFVGAEARDRRGRTTCLWQNKGIRSGAASEYSPRGRGFPAGTAKRAEGYPDNDCQRREPRFQGRSCGANMRSVGAEKAIAD
jgi:hypothetical protein